VNILLPYYFQNLKLEDFTLENELFLQKEISPPNKAGLVEYLYNMPSLSQKQADFHLD